MANLRFQTPQTRRRPPYSQVTGDPYVSGGRLRLRTRLVILVMLGLTVGLASYNLWINHVTAEAQAAEDRQLQLVKKVDQQDGVFEQALAGIRQTYPGLQISVALATDQTGVHDFGDDVVFDAASTAKVLTAAAYLHQVDKGQVSLHQTIAGQSAIYWLRAMIINSDDNAWAVLNDYLGHPYLLEYARSQGMVHYDPETNQLTSRDMARLLQKLADGTLLSTQRHTLLFSLMQKANYRDYMVAAVPLGMTVAHKVGFTDGNIHDVGIIQQGGHWLTLCIYTNGDDSFSADQRAAAIQAITKAALVAYF